MSFPKQRSLLLALVAVLSTLAPVPALAQQVLSDQELAMLPAYCRSHPNTVLHDIDPTFIKRIDQAESARWKSVIGEHAWQGLHHYCWAQANANRARRESKDNRERLGRLRGTIGDLNYILGHTRGRPFILTPEIHTRKGSILLEVGDVAAGMIELQRALEFKPDYWPPYAMISDQFKTMGDIPKAKEWLQKGLAAVPDAPPLVRRATALGVPIPPRKAPAPPPPAQPASPKEAPAAPDSPAAPSAGEPSAGK